MRRIAADIADICADTSGIIYMPNSNGAACKELTSMTNNQKRWHIELVYSVSTANSSWRQRASLHGLLAPMRRFFLNQNLPRGTHHYTRSTPSHVYFSNFIDIFSSLFVHLYACRRLSYLLRTGGRTFISRASFGKKFTLSPALPLGVRSPPPALPLGESSPPPHLRFVRQKVHPPALRAAEGSPACASCGRRFTRLRENVHPPALMWEKVHLCERAGD
ncbi:unnamed protein product [Acanthosepion pharaonis]|uniref:Uncharacterized protein n=1 Tax=Acanthosepion pharaonis TaxID=158019 RepID=A0A812BF29_ACAPH|nr:unnamed protein product [Sepia pharaonis]